MILPPRRRHEHPRSPSGYSLYVGDLFAAGKGLVKAEFDLHAMSRYEMTPEVAAAVTEMATTTSELVTLFKWTQDLLRHIDWHERPVSKRHESVVPLSVVEGGRR